MEIEVKVKIEPTGANTLSEKAVACIIDEIVRILRDNAVSDDEKVTFIADVIRVYLGIEVNDDL